MLLILILPLFNSILGLLIGRKLGNNGFSFITIILIILNILIFISCYLSIEHISYLNFLNYINLSLLNVSWSLELNDLISSLLIPVLIISIIVHIYSISYIAHDPHLPRFLSLLSFFTFSMILLVVSNSLLQLFIGWELIGISSYLLIGFWFIRLESSVNAIKAFILNRLGDVALSIGLYFIFINFYTLDFNILNNLSYNNDNIIFLGSCIILAAIAKSAQLGLNTWLPDAISGPTPVSALIHAATLVTAGCFLLIRINLLLSNTPSILLIIGIIGSTTALFAGTVGIVQNDLKRIIAFSTCSQIGYLFLAISMIDYQVAIFHLVNHAYFKALLFLSAGIIIHSINDLQDIRKFGGLLYYLPFCYLIILIGSFSLIAIPFFTGFYSKEFILELAFNKWNLQSIYLYFLGSIAASLTGYYSIRIIFLTFLSKPNNRIFIYYNLHQPNFFIIIPLILLFLIALIYGYMSKDIHIGLGTLFLGNYFYNYVPLWIEAEFNIIIITKFIPLTLTLFGFYIGYLQSTNSINLFKNISLYKFLSNKWYLDNIINFLAYKILSFGIITTKILDKGLIEFVGPSGITYFFINFNWVLLLSNNFYYYATILIVTLLIVLIP